MNLIQTQDAAIAEMMLPRTSEKRAFKHRRAVLRKFEAQALKRGYSAEEAKQARRDVLDMYNLYVLCEDSDDSDE